ncbi:putative protein isoform X1 [Capsicum chacoense]
MKHLVNGSESQGDGLIVRGGRTRERNSGGDDRNRSKSRNRNKTSPKPKGNQPEKFGEAIFVEDGGSDGELLIVSDGNSKPCENWILDSAYTFHMCRNRDWFITYETVSKGVVLMRNNTPCKIVGIGTIIIKMFDGVVRTLGDVQYVPDLKRNLISLSTLDSNGYRDRESLQICMSCKTTVTGDATISISSLLESDVAKLWHMHLGHMSENGMVELSRRGLLDGQSITKLEFCEHCIFGKQKRVRFTKGIHSTKGTLDYIHSDLWGPAGVPSKGGANYLLTIIDDYSRKVCG